MEAGDNKRASYFLHKRDFKGDSKVGLLGGIELHGWNDRENIRTGCLYGLTRTELSIEMNEIARNCMRD